MNDVITISTKLTSDEPYDRKADFARILEAKDNWLAKEAERRAHDYYVRGEAMRAVGRHIARALYAKKKAEHGEEVGTYQKRDRSIHDYEGTLEERERQLARDYARDRRGKDENTVRPRTDLSAMTEEEKKEHKRELANKRRCEQRKRDRQKPKQAPLPPLPQF